MSIFRIERSSDDHAVYSGFDVTGPQKKPLITNIHTIVSEMEPCLRKLEKEMRRKSYKEDEIRYVQKWDRFLEDSDLCFYFPHLESNYVLKIDNCVLMWYHEALRKLPRMGGYLEHDFFAGELVRVEEPIALILRTIESAIRMNIKKKNQLHLTLSLKIYLEDLTRKQAGETGFKFVQVHTCSEKKVGDIFRTLCGDKLKWDYSLSPIDGFSPGGFVGESEKYELGSREWVEEGFREGFGKAGGYFQLGGTWWYNRHYDSEDTFIGETGWAAVFETDVRLLCSPFWPDLGQP